MPLRDALGGRDRANLKMHLDAMIKQDERRTWRRSIEGAPGDGTLSISMLTRNHGNVMR